MKKTIAIMCMLLPLLCGCEYNFELPGSDDVDKLSLTCVVNGEGRTYLNLELAAPVNKYITDKKVRADIEMMELKVNGEVCPLRTDTVAVGTELEGLDFWSIERKVLPGDVVSVRARARGTAEVSGETTVPQPIRIRDFSARRDTSYTSYLTLKVDNALKEDFYGVEINSISLDSLWVNGELKRAYETARYIYPSEVSSGQEALIEYGGMDAYLPAYYNGFTINPSAGSRMYVFSGELFEGDEISFQWYGNNPGTYEYDTVDYERNEDGDWVEVVHHIRESVTMGFKVDICRVSPDFFRYGRARYIMDNNYFAEYGLSAPSFSYSNIEGGFGICASLTSDSTGWFSF